MEKRRYDRVRVSIYIDWGDTPYCLWQDRITSLSAGGCFVQTARGLATKQKIYLRLYLPGGERILRGVVRYCLERVGLGVEFFELMERDREQLGELVRHYRDAPPGPAEAGRAS